MIALLCFFLTLFASPFKSKSRLEAENAALRHQVIVLQRRVRGRVQLTNGDRLFLVQLYRWFPSVLNAITIIRPETLIRWHRAGFRRYRWHSATVLRENFSKFFFKQIGLNFCSHIRADRVARTARGDVDPKGVAWTSPTNAARCTCLSFRFMFDFPAD